MNVNGKWIGWGLNDRSPDIVSFKNWLRPRFSYARGLDSSDLYDSSLQAVVAEARRRLGLSNDGVMYGVWDWALQVKIGYRKAEPVKVNCYIIPGTWSGPHDGPPAWVMDWVDKTRFVPVWIEYLARGFLNPDPNTSYEESLADGIEKTVAAILRTPGPIVLIGYSQGADVAVHVMHEFKPGGRLANRRGDLKRVICFGNPGRPPGRDFFGKVFTDAGISGVYPPSDMASLLHSYDFEQDMYANANALMKQFYLILTKLELSVNFFMAMLQILGGGMNLFGGTGGGNVLLGNLLKGMFGDFGGNPLQRINAVAPFANDSQKSGLLGLLSNPSDIVVALQRLMQFATTNAHGRYGGSEAWLDYDGTDAVRHAARELNSARF
jgi:hypothetical protein